MTQRSRREDALMQHERHVLWRIVSNRVSAAFVAQSRLGHLCHGNLACTPRIKAQQRAISATTNGHRCAFSKRFQDSFTINRANEIQGGAED